MMPISPTHLPSTVINSCDATSRADSSKSASPTCLVPGDFNLTTSSPRSGSPTSAVAMKSTPVGGSNNYGTNRILHHTIRLPDFSQELRCFQTVTCYQAVVNNREDALRRNPTTKRR
ncbi:hypothetical protein ACFX1X_020417 [Malus domestica]